jgi:hypothetical protein
VEVVFEDTGLPLPEQTVAAFAAPLSWGGVRSLGMNLAVARAVLGWNAGSLRGENSPGRGCAMTVTLRQAASERGDRSSPKYCDNQQFLP